MVLILHILRIVVLNLRSAPAGFRNPYLNVLISQLQKIPVARYHDDLHALCLALLRHGTQNIIGLEAGHRKDRNLHGSENFFHQIYLLMKFLRHGLSRSLILFKHLMAERRFL